MHTAVLLCLLLAAWLALRLYSVLPSRRPRTKRTRAQTETCSLAVFLGSGGHTSEALALLSALDFRRYTPRTYVLSHGDVLSAQKARALEAAVAAASSSPKEHAPSHAPYTILTIPRARAVHQPLLTTPLTAARSLLVCCYHMTLLPLLRGAPFADVLVLNGPGTCVTLCLAAYLNRLLGLPTPTLLYVESFARVRSLSLSGALLRPLVDRFVVQWKSLLRDGRRGDYRGWLV